ncbi:MAG: GNAT family N-acetyltransferase, partial [Actinomycetota bacterium]|nr:GNAT family N-acetyltransferase [Actinomycetota bacterium]
MTPTSPPRNDDIVTLDVLLRTGRMAQLRPVRGADEPALRDLNARISLGTRMRRYFTSSEEPGSWYIDQLMSSKNGHQALVAFVDDRVVALAGFARLERDPTVADLALLVDDAHQSEGLGALLLEHLANLAAHHGIATFVADVLIDNTPMLHLLSGSGFAVRSHPARGVAELHVELADRPELRAAVHHRDTVAERASLRRVLAPRSVAVVGSSRSGSVAD